MECLEDAREQDGGLVPIRLEHCEQVRLLMPVTQHQQGVRARACPEPPSPPLLRGSKPVKHDLDQGLLATVTFHARQMP